MESNLTNSFLNELRKATFPLLPDYNRTHLPRGRVERIQSFIETRILSRKMNELKVSLESMYIGTIRAVPTSEEISRIFHSSMILEWPGRYGSHYRR